MCVEWQSTMRLVVHHLLKALPTDGSPGIYFKSQTTRYILSSEAHIWLRTAAWGESGSSFIPCAIFWSVNSPKGRKLPCVLSMGEVNLPQRPFQFGSPPLFPNPAPACVWNNILHSSVWIKGKQIGSREPRPDSFENVLCSLALKCQRKTNFICLNFQLVPPPPLHSYNI